MAQNKDTLRQRLEALKSLNLLNLLNLDEDGLDNALSAILYRQNCPDKMALGDYALGLLAVKGQTQIADHLAYCPHCRAEVANFAQSLATDDLLTALETVSTPKPAVTPDPSWVEQAFDYGRAWLEQESGRWRQVVVPLSILSRSLIGGQSDLRAAQPVLMSETSAAPSTRTDGLTVAPSDANFELALNISPGPVTTGDPLCQLAVMLTCMDRFGDFSGIQVVLEWGEQVYAQETDPLGEVTFSQLPCGQVPHMNLTVTLPV